MLNGWKKSWVVISWKYPFCFARVGAEGRLEWTFAATCVLCDSEQLMLDWLQFVRNYDHSVPVLCLVPTSSLQANCSALVLRFSRDLAEWWIVFWRWPHQWKRERDGGWSRVVPHPVVLHTGPLREMLVCFLSKLGPDWLTFWQQSGRW